MIRGYAQPLKSRSWEVLRAFVKGAGCGEVVSAAEGYAGGPAAFYGTLGLESMVRRAFAEGEVYFGDNAFFDRARGAYFRFARNAFQVSELQPPDHDRLRALGVKIRDWHTGRHVLVVEQSPHHLELSGAGENWLERTLAELREATDRPIRIRRWNRAKQAAAATLADDLRDAHALVTWTSAAAVEAVCAGVPAFVGAPCAASPMASGALRRIEDPARPDGRDAWAAGLANAQWTVAEIAAGEAWRRIGGKGLVSDSRTAA